MLPKTREVFEDFSNGIQDWSSRDRRSIKTYKFQCPDIDRANDKRLSLKIDPQGKRLALRLGVGSRFLSRPDNLGDFTYSKVISGTGPQDAIVDRKEFKSADNKILEWSKVETFTVTLVDVASKQKIDLTSPEGHAILQSIRLVD